jgi:hypothetical protein
MGAKNTKAQVFATKNVVGSNPINKSTKRTPTLKATPKP